MNPNAPINAASAAAPLLLGIAVLVAAKVLAGPRRSITHDTLGMLLVSVGWVLIAGGIGFWACWLFSGPSAEPSGLFCLFAVFSGVVAVFTAFDFYRARQHALWSVLAVAADRMMPLGPAIEAFADEHGGRFASRARKAARLIGAGASLPNALEQVPGLVSRAELAMLRAGHDTGTLSGVLGQVPYAQRSRMGILRSSRAMGICLGYVLGFLLSILTFFALKILPEFQMIFAEFGSELPALTEWTVRICSFPPLRSLLFWLLLFVVVGPWFVAFGDGTRPGWLWVTLLDTALLLDILGQCARHERPLREGLASLARSYPGRAMRVRLRVVLRGLDSGVDWCTGLAANGLVGQADQAVLHAAQRAGNLPWALHEMAERNVRRLGYRLGILLQILYPVAIVSIGLVVGLFALVGLLPLVRLMELLA